MISLWETNSAPLLTCNISLPLTLIRLGVQTAITPWLDVPGSLWTAYKIEPANPCCFLWSVLDCWTFSLCSLRFSSVISLKIIILFNISSALMITSLALFVVNFWCALESNTILRVYFTCFLPTKPIWGFYFKEVSSPACLLSFQVACSNSNSSSGKLNIVL